MIKIKTEDIYTLQTACESLAYKLAEHEHPHQYDVSDEQVGSILECEELEIEITHWVH